MNITIKARLTVAMTFLGLLLLLSGVLGLIGMSRANDATREIFTNQMPGAVSTESAEMFTARERLSFERAALLGGTPDADIAIGRGTVMRQTADKAWADYAALSMSADERPLAEAFENKRIELKKQLDEGYANIRANNHDGIVASAQSMQVAFNELADKGAALRQFQFDSAKLGFDQAQQTFETFRTITIIAIVLGLAMALFSWFSLRRSIGRPLDEALGHFEAIAAGDLRRQVDVTSGDEMGLLMKGLAKMQASLAATVQTVRAGSESIASATKQIAAGNIDLSSRTEEQASALQETASSMDELTGTVKQNADNARQASSLAANASEIANKGSRVVAQVVGTMGDINQSSAKIADIITIIEGIAFQTNILALNAAVEAARAGEEGRGFAVVAGEVRSLAQRSSAAAKEIKGLIDTSVERVQSGTSLVDEAGRTMAEIIGAVQRVTDIMGEIAAASEEQSSGIEQVARAVTQMDEVTQQNAALVEEAAAAAQSLEDQAAKLRHAVSVFQVDEVVKAYETSKAVKRAPAVRSAVTKPVRAASKLVTPATRFVRKIEPVVAATNADWQAF
jgi:methyl-accepting chemotaxis protein-1 (serine sensor receptor)